MKELALAVLPLAIWLYLLAGRGGFWLAQHRDVGRNVDAGFAPAEWPSIVAVVPARDEAATVAATVGSLLHQDYPGALTIILVDDQSLDGTAAAARHAAEVAGAAQRLAVITGRDLPAGWTGKVWAMHQGIAAIEASPKPPSYVLFTDADIELAPDALRGLVRIALTRGYVLASLMAELRCASLAERALIPAFVFFFQKLYPFAWVNDPARSTAGAAGGCMLVRRDALRAAGGLDRIRDALIDDCALAALLKRQGPIWLGLTRRVRSLRPYGLGDIHRMVARTAFAQLGYSYAALAAAVVAMALTYAAPPLIGLFGDEPARALGLASWALMAIAYAPMLAFYDIVPLAALALPLIAIVYIGFTLDSAWRHWRGRGGAWKGRFQAGIAGGTEA